VDSPRTGTIGTSSTSHSNTEATTTIIEFTQSGRRKRKYNSNADDEQCMCGCNNYYNATSMSDCKGVRCPNRVNRNCVPNTWKCQDCRYLQNENC
jgi:hypothetical protein